MPMELGLFFTPVEESLTNIPETTTCMFHHLYVHRGQFPDLKGIELAIIGVKEFRGVDHASGVAGAVDQIRKKLYRLKPGTKPYKVADLGDLKNGETTEDTYLRLKEVCYLLLEANVLPLIVGGTHDLDIGQYRGYDGLDKLITVLNIDARLDIEDQDNGTYNASHIQKIFLNEPNYLFNYIHLAYQSYLVDPKAIGVLEKLFFESYRLGQIRENFQNIEPIVRDADMISFDVSAIKSVDAPGTNAPVPFGLSGEEACQICWYAGLNDKLSSAGFYEYDPVKDDEDHKTAFVVATMIWYFIEGVCHRKYDHHLKVNDYIKYVVNMPSDDSIITFYKSTRSERWWMEVPHPNPKSKMDRNQIVPCSYTDYELANKGEIPDRWLSTYNKLL
jgi:formiminoglutamase